VNSLKPGFHHHLSTSISISISRTALRTPTTHKHEHKHMVARKTTTQGSKNTSSTNIYVVLVLM